MELALSAAALPGAPLAELLDACARRGMRALELAWDDATAWSEADAAAARGEAAARGITLVGCRTASPALALSAAGARLSAALGTPVVLAAEPGPGDDLAGAAAEYAAAGAMLLLAHGSDPAATARLRSRVEALGGGGVGLCWEVRPGDDDLAEARALLAAAGPHLRLVRLHGGGPEAMGQTGRGVGEVMTALTLARYRGPLALCPSTAAYHLVWARWLGRAGGWGCGSRTGDGAATLVGLGRDDGEPTTTTREETDR